MLQMHKAIISDTSCFIVLTNIDELDLLHKVYGQVMTTVEVAAEYGEPLPEWVQIATVTDTSAMALALETPNSILIIDDYRARKVADKLELSYTGTIGVIISAIAQPSEIFFRYASCNGTL